MTYELNSREEIAQCIYLALSTQKGSDPLRPDFGTNLHKYIDKPLPQVETMIIYEAMTAIKRWEPRVLLKTLHVSQQASEGMQLHLTVEFTTDGTSDSLTIKL
jgi:phage baseplate assembly protein W